MRIIIAVITAGLACLCFVALAVEFSTEKNKKTAEANPSKLTESKLLIKVPNSTGFFVYERCIDGVKYLVTDNGGISPKLKNGPGGLHAEMCE